MTRFTKAHLLLFAAMLLSLPAIGQAAPPPRIFFTDLQSGPNSGGDSQSGYSGVYVTLYGNFFGASQGSSTVTLNGVSCLRIVSWGTTWLGYQKLVVQLGSACTSGNFVVNTSAGASNGASFTVRSGNIYCISPTGSDSNNGKFPSSCWATMANAAGNMSAGDTVYLKDGVINTTVTSYSAVVNITGNPGGTAAAPIAFIAYPGAKATIGDINSSPYAIRVPQIGLSPAYYVFAGLTLRGQEAMDAFAADHWWIVGNDMSCTAGGIGCFHSNQATNLFLYGNNVHDISGAVKLYHAIYFTTNTNHVWAGWNLVDPDPNHTGSAGCRGIQFYSTSGSDQYDIHVHDNVIRNTVCDGLAMTTVNPNAGAVEVYNNSIYHAGTGPDPQGQLSHYTCIQINSGTSTVTTPALIYNNSLYDCGSRGYPGISGAFELDIPTQLSNNSAYMTSSSEAYVGGSCSNASGSNNNWFGNGAAPCAANLTGSKNVNPGYTSTAGTVDLSLQSSSALINAGTTVSVASQDITGVSRPQGGAYDIGAYEYYAGSVAVSPCDLNADGAVNNNDYQLALNQALGLSTCSNADLDGNGACTVVDVQRVINAAQGQACVVGP